MTEQKISAGETLFTAGGMFGGIGLAMLLGFTVLPKGVLWFGLYGMAGAVMGALAGQMLWKAMGGGGK
jgi:hypothetical protein